MTHLPITPPSPETAAPAVGRSARRALRLGSAPLASGGTTAIVVGTAVVVAWALIALTSPWWTPYDPVTDQNLAQRLAGPSAAHWFGTDYLGRDVFSRVMAGARLSLPVAGAAVALALLVGGALGAVAGFAGGLLDEVAMRVSDLFMSFPAMILALAIAAALGPSALNVVIAIAAVTWPEYTRLMRGQVLAVKGNLHVLAAESVGCRRGRVFRRHVLPFVTPALVVKATVDLGMAVLLAAGLSFIGVGAPPPAPEWGSMVSEAASRIDQWWLGLFPGLAILSIVLSVNFVGDAMRDRYDPRMRAQRTRRSARTSAPPVAAQAGDLA